MRRHREKREEKNSVICNKKKMAPTIKLFTAVINTAMGGL
jgi:hypothetical protein